MNTGLNWYEAEVVKVYLDDKKIIKDVINYYNNLNLQVMKIKMVKNLKY